MSFTEFENHFSITPSSSFNSRDEYETFMKRYCDVTVNNGLYRVISSEQMEEFRGNIAYAFPAINGQFKLFGYDWLGRVFGLDMRESLFFKPTQNVLIFDVASGEVYDTELNIVDFHNKEMVNNTDICLETSLFGEWMSQNNQSIKRNECVGLMRPFFLGGDCSLSNMELADIDVYLYLTAQMLRRV